MENKKNFIINTLYYVLIFGLIYVFCNYLLGILAPFIIGFLFAYFGVKIARNVFKKENRIVRIISLILLYVLIVCVISILIALGVNQLVDLIATVPTLYREYVEPVLKSLSGNINNNAIELPFGISSDLKEISDTLLNAIKTLVSNVSSYIVSGSTSIISNTSNIVISLFASVITSFFVVADYENIIGYLESIMPKKVKEVYDEVTEFLVNTVLLIVKSYGTIMFITFIELLIGLFIIGVDDFALIAMITAFLDIWPVLGVGLVLIPWFVYEFFVGNIRMGVMLLVLEIVITIIRNIIEPRIVGNNIGIHPLATLFSMLVGLQLFGALGMFGFPLVISFFIGKKDKQTALKKE